MTLFLTACGDEDNDDKTATSVNGGQESHNVGQNCLSCHKAGGPGEPVFTVAGSVYQKLDLTLPLPNVKIQFHDDPNATGTLIHSIEVDAFGNFYTTNGIVWGSGLYVSVAVPGTATSSMSFSITDGECGRCHGVTEIVVNG